MLLTYEANARLTYSKAITLLRYRETLAGKVVEEWNKHHPESLQISQIGDLNDMDKGLINNFRNNDKENHLSVYEALNCLEFTEILAEAFENEKKF